jgi:hypothetical protein
MRDSDRRRRRIVHEFDVDGNVTDLGVHATNERNIVGIGVHDLLVMDCHELASVRFQ